MLVPNQFYYLLTLVLLTRIWPAFAKSVEEANWSGSALFVIQYVNLYQQFGLSNLIGWQLEMGMASQFCPAWQEFCVKIAAKKMANSVFSDSAMP